MRTCDWSKSIVGTSHHTKKFKDLSTCLVDAETPLCGFNNILYAAVVFSPLAALIAETVTFVPLSLNFF